jgi:hypothetical protein
MAAVGTDEPKSGLKVCVVGSGTGFISGISYYTYFLACAFEQLRRDLALPWKLEVVDMDLNKR